MILNTIFRIFLKNLNDANIRKKITKDMKLFDKFLRSFYLWIKEIRIIKVELKKFKKKEKRAKEFQLYKNYANNLLDKSKLITLWSKYIMFNNTNWKLFVLFSINHESINYVFNFNNKSFYASKSWFQSRFEINNYRRSIEKYNRSFIDKQTFNQSTFKNLSNRKISNNSYINCDDQLYE